MKIFTRWWGIVPTFCIIFAVFPFTQCLLGWSIPNHLFVADDAHRHFKFVFLWWRWLSRFALVCHGQATILASAWTRSFSCRSYGQHDSGCCWDSKTHRTCTQHFRCIISGICGHGHKPVFLWVHSDVLLCTLFVFIIFQCFVIALVVRAFGFSTRVS